jgi:hypothetical protein
MSQSSSMLIVNKVPAEKYLERKRKQGEQYRYRNEEMQTTFDEFSKALNISFKYTRRPRF